MNSQTSRDRILARLRASGAEGTTVPVAPVPGIPTWNREEKIARMAELMGAIRTEVHIVAADDWRNRLKDLPRQKGWKRLVYGPESPIGPDIEASWSSEDGKGGDGLPSLVPYTGPAETFKEELFRMDAGITSTVGAVAETGAVVLWPTPEEPRLLSLVPPVHVAVLDADTIYGSLAEMMTEQNWADGMPTNALLISGPSKTADIEFTLVFGVHGPKEMLVLIRK
jgi:L-lactate dehydrogenase complex protein LldG